MAKKKKNTWLGIVLGPLLSLLALCALWKNETRFDYYRAAAATPEMASLNEAIDGEVMSLTGAMDRKLTYSGEYVESITGYLTVWRKAEIYAWDEKEDDDGGSTYTMRWMSRVDNNPRNSGVTKRLASRQFLAPEYRVGDLTVTSDSIEFVDDDNDIQANSLTLSRKGEELKLKPNGEYLYLYKNRSRQLGDERVSYEGIPVPSRATYFGKFQAGGVGVADRTHQRDGFINTLIRDTGILHHIAAGDRTTGLATMKSHIRRLKWIVRGVGTAFVVGGFVLLFSTLFHFLYYIPLIGSMIESGVMFLSLALGVPLALLTIVAGMLVANPLVLFLLLAGVIAMIYYVHRRGAKSQQRLKTQLDEQYGHVLTVEEMIDLEFFELVHLGRVQSGIDDSEREFLRDWTRSKGWDQQKVREMLERAKESSLPQQTEMPTEKHLGNLIRLALADGQLTRSELVTIRVASQRAGYDNAAVDRLINQVRSGDST